MKLDSLLVGPTFHRPQSLLHDKASCHHFTRHMVNYLLADITHYSIIHMIWFFFLQLLITFALVEGVAPIYQSISL